MVLGRHWRIFQSLLLLLVGTGAVPARAQSGNKQSPPPAVQDKKPTSDKNAAAAKAPSPEEELQRAISDAGNDRAALVRNLEAFLVKYPDSPQRPQIYRALVEAQPATAGYHARGGVCGASRLTDAGRHVHHAGGDSTVAAQR